MTQGNTALVDGCQYLVRRPNEIFLKAGEQAPEKGGLNTAEFSQEELLQQTVYIQHRPIKDPRDIKMLDPACGSMHFGLYAFDLFEQIYSDAWDIEADKGSEIFFNEAGVSPRNALHETYPSKEDFLADVPRLIVEHNIHGVDIDPRAAQIAGLSLWLRAQKSWSDNAIQPNQRPQIQRSNIVCAEPMPGETQLLKEFTSQVQPRVLGQLVEEIFEKMQLAGEAGTLLKIEEEIRSAIDEAKSQKDENVLEVQGGLFGGDKWEVREGKRYYNFGDVNDDFWEQAEKLILLQLERYAERASGEGSSQKRLFASDAAKGFAFIDLCRKRFDVVVMNPPFGECSLDGKAYLAKNYPTTKSDLACSFAERATGLLVAEGVVGELTNRTWFFAKKHAKWRKILLESCCITNLADLGYGVLDAVVEAAALVWSKTDAQCDGSFVSALEEKEKSKKLAIRADYLWANSKVFLRLKNNVFAYWIPQSMLSKYIEMEKVDSAWVKKGLSTADNFRFFRTRWEVSPYSKEKNRGLPEGWKPIAKGGEYRPYFDDIHLDVNWHDDARELKAYISQRYPYLKGDWAWVIVNSDYYFDPALTWSYRTSSACCMKVLPKGCVFSDGGWALSAPSRDHMLAMLALFNLPVGRYFMELPLGVGDTSRSGTAARNYSQEPIAAVPFIDVPCESIVDAVFLLVSYQIRRDRCLETSAFYSGPFDLEIQIRPSLREMVLEIASYRLHATLAALKATDLLNTIFESASGFDSSDISVVREQEGVHPFSYQDHEISNDIVMGVFSLQEPALLKEAYRVLGGKRFATKKSYFIDRRLELVSHILKLHPDRVVKSILECDEDVFQFYNNDVSKSIFHHLFGVAIGAWKNSFLNVNDVPLESIDDCFSELPSFSPAVDLDRISQNIILVDDPSHDMDVVKQMMLAAASLFGDGSSTLFDEVVAGLKGGFRDFLRGDYFNEHLDFYSKSRRQSPVYWPLQTPTKSYTIWVYYQRLDSSILFACVNDFVAPKLDSVERRIFDLRASSNRSASDEKLVSELDGFAVELRDFRDELLRLAQFWIPNLDDGVQITAAPLWKLFQHNAWQKKLKKTWGELEKGKYDWSHLAYSIWPRRVLLKSKQNLSVAIAHSVEGDLWVPAEIPPGKDSTGFGWEAIELSEADFEVYVEKKIAQG